jgi:uncharacterized protein (UPF0276 family)
MSVMTSSRPIPAAAGIGLRLQHMPALANEEAAAPLSAAWFEIHSENFLNSGGARMAMLDEIATRYPISCHGVGLSLGSAQGLSTAHLQRLKNLFARVRPGLISEHLAWSVVDGAYLNDLLPLPYTEDTLRLVCDNIAHAQDTFGEQILIENPSSYLQFHDSSMPEWDFLSRLVERTSCGLLLDVNNVYVSACNNGFSAGDYMRHIPWSAVGEIHVAGHSVEIDGNERILVDTHSSAVCDEVWDLYRAALAGAGAVPTLIEWDLDLPAFSILQAEAAKAQAALEDAAAKSASHAA